MGVHVATKQITPPQRADPQRSSLQKSSCGACSGSSPINRLQRAVGNRALSSLLRSPIIQPKLTVSEPDDPYEREADRVADQVMRMPDAQSVAPLGIGNSSVVQRKCACGGGSDESCKCPP